ncbi:MAG: hypothetical protein M3458_14860 [Acidobacteriota bacterium]|nr:hypothetical protein [Acidobacteriota bacterium]
MSTSYFQGERRQSLLERLNTAHLVIGLIIVLSTSVGGAYLSTRLAESELRLRVQTIEATTLELKETRTSFVTRQESQFQWEYLQKDLREIKDDVREIRTRTETKH